MNKLTKIILAVVVVVVILIGGAPFALPLIVNLNNYKPEIAAAVREQTGRDLIIAGDIEYSIFPKFKLTLSDVKLSNAPGMPTPEMMTVAGVSAEIDTLALLSREVIVDKLVIENPSLFLEVADDGRANWVLEAQAPAEAAAEPGGPPEIGDLKLGDVRIVNGLFSYIDAGTGQSVQAREINVSASLAGIGDILGVKLSMIVNDEPVTADVTVNSPAKALAGDPFALGAALASKYVNVNVDGSVLQKPVPGFDGGAGVDIGSVGKLAAWLGRPLDEAQPDPGPLKIAAKLTADGGKVVLEQASIKGTALDAKAKGSVDASGDITQVTLDLESGVLDIDRYLPPQAPAAKMEAAAPAKPSAGPGNPFEALPNEPIDLSALRQTEADIKIRIGGIKAMGFNVGKVAFTSTLKGGVLAADLAELRLYGGNVSGQLKLDASGEALGVGADLAVDKVKVGDLARAATGGEAPVAGIASGTVKAATRGRSARDLAQGLSGRLVFELGGVNVKDAPAGAITALNVDLNLPDLESAPTLKGSVVYNKRKVAFDVTLDPLKKVLAEDRFAVAAAIESELVKAGYKGSVQQRPLPGLDGDFDLDVASVGRLAAWLGQPLDKSQPDPGPLKVHASFAADQGKVALKGATIQGTALEAKANGSYDGTGKVSKVVLNLETGVLDVDRYLPPPAPAQQTATQQAAPAAGDPLAALSNEPIDLTPLRQTDADIKVDIGGIKAMGYEIGHVAMGATLAGGVLAANLNEIVLYGGKVNGKVDLDGSSEVLKAAVDLAVANVKVDALAKAATGETPIVGTANGSVKASTEGKSPRALVEGLKGKVAFNLGGVDVKDAQLGTISELAVNLDLPGIEAPPSLKGAVVYNKERVTVDLALDPLRKVLGGERFALKAKVASNLVNLAYDGAVLQKPVPGLDGAFNLDVASVGKLAAWLGQPLDKSQPDPGPLKVAAQFTSDGKKSVLKSADIQGKAVKATAQGSFDGSGQVPSLIAEVNVAELDLNAYLPPEQKKAKGKAKPEPAAKTSQGWSSEPIDFSPLSRINADVKIQTGPVKYRTLVIDRSRVTAVLRDAVLKATIDELAVAGGTVTGGVTVDASRGQRAGLAYQVAVNGVQAKPVLSALADMDYLSGTTQVQTKGQAQGASEKEIVSTLNGDGALKFLDGAIEGINLAATLRKAKTLGFDPTASEQQKTDFAELGGTFTIKNGVVDNRDFKMLAPLVRVGGAGLVPMPPRTVDYKVEAKLVATTKGQGGENSLAGLPIPIRVTGSWDNPSYKVDWASVFRSAALDPERLKNMPADLKDAAKGFGVALPGVSSGGVSDAIGGVLKKIPGVSSGSQTEGGTTTEQGTGSTEPAKPLDKIKDLFGG